MDRPAQCKTTILPPFVWVAGRELAIACTGMALLMVVGVPRAYAPQREKPEKISIDNVTWNSQAHAFHRSVFCPGDLRAFNHAC